MSFRSRLLLFFVIIVVVPMIAVALVLFSITADSETGKADAAVAQGLRAAFAVYDGDRKDATDQLERIARDAELGTALESGNPSLVRARVRTLHASVSGVRGISVYDPRRRLLASAGAPDAVAHAVAAPATDVTTSPFSPSRTRSVAAPTSGVTTTGNAHAIASFSDTPHVSRLDSSAKTSAAA